LGGEPARVGGICIVTSDGRGCRGVVTGGAGGSCCEEEVGGVDGVRSWLCTGGLGDPVPGVTESCGRAAGSSRRGDVGED